MSPTITPGRCSRNNAVLPVAAKELSWTKSRHAAAGASPQCGMPEPSRPSHLAERARRGLWFAAGVIAAALGVVGAFVPLLPTVPFMLLALMCFSRGCERCERWLLAHPQFGPPLRDWRAHRAVSLAVKRIATFSMALGSLLAWWWLGSPERWVPGGVCALVALWMWRLPTRVRSA